MSRLNRSRPLYSFCNFIPARPQPQSSRSGRLCAGRTCRNPLPFYVLGRNLVSYVPFESRAIPLNILTNNGLMACASGRLPEICLRGRQGTHAGAIKRRSVPAVTACGRSHVVSWTVKYLTASLIERRVSPRNSVTELPGPRSWVGANRPIRASSLRPP
jgi:hypothetical protein